VFGNRSRGDGEESRSGVSGAQCSRGRV
jgi:hypothetical protein